MRTGKFTSLLSGSESSSAAAGHVLDDVGCGRENLFYDSPLS